MKDMQVSGEIEAPCGDRKSLLNDVTMISQPQTLKEAGFNNGVEAHRCKTLADMPEEEFERHISQRR
ncbi:MAG: hypothetical protein ACHQ6U_08605 [Thermodesulfobacteriota bacterium]